MGGVLSSAPGKILCGDVSAWALPVGDTGRPPSSASLTTEAGTESEGVSSGSNFIRVLSAALVIADGPFEVDEGGVLVKEGSGGRDVFDASGKSLPADIVGLVGSVSVVVNESGDVYT